MNKIRAFGIFIGFVTVLAVASRVLGFAALALLNTPRTDHTATLLNSGKVLVAGGQQAGVSSSMNSVELYDPAADKWTVIASLKGERRNHTATLLPDGRVLVAGGIVGQLSFALNTVEIFDPVAGTWSSAANMNAARGSHTATLLGNGRVLVAGGLGATVGGAGGSSGALNSSEIYDPAANTWTPAGNLALDRYLHTASLLSNGNVLVVGGTVKAGSATTSAELFDPLAGTWRQAAPLTGARTQHSATVMSNGVVLVAGGVVSGTSYLNTTELYDPAQNVWNAGANLSVSRASHTATLLGSGKVLVTGGTNGALLKSAEMFDPAAGTWSSAGTLLIGRSEHTATVMPNGKVFFTGGAADNGVTEIYDSSTNQAPGINSGPTAAPNPTGINTPIAFSVIASDQDNDPLTFSWDFGDGTTETSAANTTHTYTASGPFTVKVSVSDGKNPPVSANVMVNITSTLSMTVAKASIKLNFAKSNSDTIAYSGTMDVPPFFHPGGSQIVLEVGGVKKTLLLNDKAQAVTGGDSVKITLNKKADLTKASTAKFSASFKKGTFAEMLAGSGLTNADAKSAPLTVLFRISVAGQSMNVAKSMAWTAKKGKSGAAK